jgi:hypothetical protein
MRRLLAAVLLPLPLGAQDVVLREAGPPALAAIVRDAIDHPHRLHAGSGRIEFARDSTIPTSLVVLGRPTYVASRVRGDVLVIGGDLFLRPGSEITGRAIAIGGTVARTTLGQVGGSVESFRDDTYLISASGPPYQLDYRNQRVGAPPLFQLAGLQGLLMPSYTRVDGLSLPVGALVTLGERLVELEPRLTYRSRLGVVDPGVAIRVGVDRPLRFEADVARSTRTNDDWIYSDLLNSALMLGVGRDTRNYFRADGGTARLIAMRRGSALTLEPFVGGRIEKVSPIAATGNVWSILGRSSVEGGQRPNPLVEPGTISSALGGLDAAYKAGPVTGKFRATAEQSLKTPGGTSSFTQVTLHGTVGFPTFSTHDLRIEGHAVATAGDSVPRSRYAYLGGSGTLGLLDLLEQGGPKLLFLDSRYRIPIDRIVLPFVGSPAITLRHQMGAAGVRSLPSLEQAVGVGLSVKMLRMDFLTDVAGERGSKISFGVSLSG